MAYIFDEPSRTFSEYLLVPGYSDENCVPDNVSLRAPLVRFKKGETPALQMNIPLTSAIMQAVSDDKMAVALAKEGGVSFIFGSQSIESQAAMVTRVKSYKAGFVVSDSNIRPDATLRDILELKQRTGHSTVAVTEDGTASGRLVGIVTSRDYRVSRMTGDELVGSFMTPIEKLVTAPAGTSLREANDIIWDHKLNALPIIDQNGCLMHMVFRKDYDSHKENPLELLDSQQEICRRGRRSTPGTTPSVSRRLSRRARTCCASIRRRAFPNGRSTRSFGCAINTAIHVKLGAGNVVDAEGFRFLADAGADFVKIGIGGGSICITREQKGIGRGQASALIDVARARDAYYASTGVYIPICSDGGIVYDYHITLWPSPWERIS